uniref:Zona-pellucida-binding protein 1/2 N-terminal domain-containing protein n=1 Tax=Xenopus tropicalis TaxID=8364 RepID=A0A803JFW4_XENTR
GYTRSLYRQGYGTNVTGIRNTRLTLHVAATWAGNGTQPDVELFKNSPFLACTDLETANEELIDPVFVWLGPNDRLRGHISANLTETGKLMMKAFSQIHVWVPQLHGEIPEHQEWAVSLWVAMLMFLLVSPPPPPPSQVRDQIVDFFLHFSQVQRKQFLGINYVEHSLDIRRLDSCRPGFGRNQEKQNDCCGNKSLALLKYLL